MMKGIMLESLKKIIETEYGNECEITVQSPQSCGGDGTGISAGYLFYGYPDAGNKRNPGNQGNSEI